MKVFLLIFISSIIALTVDYYIYRRVINRHNFGRIWKIGYLIYCFVVDTMVVCALLAYRWASDAEDTLILRIVMWIIGIFFLHTVPKVIYAVISLGDYVVQYYRKRRSHIFGYTGTLIAFFAAAVLLYSLTWGRSTFRVEKVEITFPELPESFDGLKIVMFSDPHIGTLVNRYDFLKRMVDNINALGADIVVNGGDIVNNHVREFDGTTQQILDQINSTYGVFSVLGNHDLGIYIKDTVKYPVSENIDELTRRQESLGWKVLRNETSFISNGMDSITISGLDYPMDFSLNSHSSVMTGADIEETFDGIPDSFFNISISHAPQLWTEMLEAGKGNLTLAGHVHSMQIKFKIGGWKWSPAKFFYNRWSGLYHEKGRYLYINDGAGYVMFPMRVGVKPELTLLILHSTGKSKSQKQVTG